MGATEDELVKIAKKLDKISNRKESSSSAQALDLLKLLAKMPITLELIQRTRIGLIVNNLRKSITDDDVGTLSKTLIKNWKKLLDTKDTKDSAKSETNGSSEAKNGNSGTPIVVDGTASSESSQGSASSKAVNGTSSKAVEKPTAPVKSTSSSATSKPAPSATSPASTAKFLRQSSFPGKTTDSIRLKCREMLSNALAPDQAMLDAEGNNGADFYDPEELAGHIEDAIYKEHKDTNMKYKNRVRSRVANLNDKKNPDLKINVLRGSISATRISKMTAEEMASDEMKNLRQKFTKEAINDAQMAMTSGTKTDLLKCPACKKSNCTYNQVQTRSADEPMTTFCFCNECGKRWKFC